jgi:hypothetical protein
MAVLRWVLVHRLRYDAGDQASRFRTRDGSPPTRWGDWRRADHIGRRRRRHWRLHQRRQLLSAIAGAAILLVMYRRMTIRPARRRTAYRF